MGTSKHGELAQELERARSRFQAWQERQCPCGKGANDGRLIPAGGSIACPCGKGANDGRLIPVGGSIAGAGVWGLGGELELVYRASAA
jgi:hypothetical protein